MKNIFAVLMVSGFLLSSGCASVPMASAEADQQAKNFETVAGKSNIYIYRNETLGAAITMPVFIDGNKVGQTAADTYLLTTVEPGEHKIVSQTEDDALLMLVTRPNENYFVWQEVKMGMWAASSDLNLVTQSVGEKGVLECKLAK